MKKAIILAAGKGTRMKSTHPKVVHKVCGKEMVNHVVDAANDAGVNETIVVLGHGIEEVKEIRVARYYFEGSLDLKQCSLQVFFEENDITAEDKVQIQNIYKEQYLAFCNRMSEYAWGDILDVTKPTTTIEATTI